MKQSKGKIGIREYIAICVFLVGTKVTDDTPTIIYSTAKNAGWISILLMSILSIIPILLLIKVLSVHKEKNLHEVVVYLFGKYFGNIVSFSLLIFLFSTVILDSAVYIDIIGTLYIPKTPNIVLFIILLTVGAYGAKRGLEHIGSTAWLTFFYLYASLVLVFIVMFNEGNPKLIYPIWGPGFAEVTKTSFRYMSIYADFFFLGLIAPLVSSFKAYKKGTILAWGIVTTNLTLAMALFVMLFDFTSIEILQYPFHEAIRYIPIGFLTNVEAIFLPFWLVAAFVRFSIYLFLVVLLFGGIFKIKQFEYLVPLMTVLVIALGVATNNPVITIPTLWKLLLTVLSPIFFALPCLMWLIAKLRGDFKNETSVDHH